MTGGGEVRLQPLTLGEIFDRTITLYVQNFTAFAVIAAMTVIPVTLCSYFATAGADQWSQLLAQMQHPGSAHDAPAFTAWYAAVIALSLLLTPFTYVALASAVNELYTSAPIDWRACYGLAMRHTGGIILTILCEIVVLSAAVFAGALIVGVLFGLAVLSLQFSRVFGGILMIPAAAAGIAYVLFFLLCYLAAAMAFVAIGAEQLSFSQAIRSGFVRVFNRQSLWRSMLICAAIAVFELALMLVVGGAAAMAALIVHQPVVSAVLQAVTAIVSTGFLGALLTVYYFDVRVRREGLDVQAALETLQPQA
ncbi:MAG: hypothetical protein ABR508_10795 [Candidatus Baltobacteraceae bacterium]